MTGQDQKNSRDSTSDRKIGKEQGQGGRERRVKGEKAVVVLGGF